MRQQLGLQLYFLRLCSKSCFVPKSLISQWLYVFSLKRMIEERKFILGIALTLKHCPIKEITLNVGNLRVGSHQVNLITCESVLC